jgi:O-antigen ligase
MLFQESVRLMLEHPLFGVGPGIFSAALASEQKQLGQLQTWREAHNSFIQLGCEAGIPALGFYLAAMLYCMKRTIRVYRRARGDPYTFHFPVLPGLVQAFYVCASKEMKNRSGDCTCSPANAFGYPNSSFAATEICAE